jgi:hypothetical protein
MSSTPATARRIAIVNRLPGDAGAAAVEFVTQLGMEPVVVEPASNGSDTSFIDRLEAVRGADYAIVLLPAGALDAAGGNPLGLLEIGFLFGVLARKRVTFLLPDKPALPPALAGLIASHQLDDGDLWRLLVAREMRKAGLDVDMNRVA